MTKNSEIVLSEEDAQSLFEISAEISTAINMGGSDSMNVSVTFKNTPGIKPCIWTELEKKFSDWHMSKKVHADRSTHIEMKKK